MARIYFPENVRYLRKRAGLKQSELAEEIGVHEQTITNYEHGKGGWPGSFTLIGLADIFNVSLDDLMFKNMDGEGE